MRKLARNLRFWRPQNWSKIFFFKAGFFYNTNYTRKIELKMPFSLFFKIEIFQENGKKALFLNLRPFIPETIFTQSLKKEIKTRKKELAFTCLKICLKIRKYCVSLKNDEFKVERRKRA